MTFYLETCNSGSMLLKMKPEWNIYAVSAAKPEQNSYATYCYPDDIVDVKNPLPPYILIIKIIIFRVNICGLVCLMNLVNLG